jgi:hypothetical protein
MTMMNSYTKEQQQQCSEEQREQTLKRQRQQQQQQHHRRRRRVQFTTQETIVSSCSSPLQKVQTENEWNSIWYTSSELYTMRQEARVLCTLLKYSKNNSKTKTTAATKMQYNYLLDDTRGLEKRVCRERQRRRYIAIKCIVRAANSSPTLLIGNNKHDTTTRLAAIAQRCNAYATNIALIEGTRDFFDAYNDELQQLLVINTNSTNSTTNTNTAQSSSTCFTTGTTTTPTTTTPKLVMNNDNSNSNSNSSNNNKRKYDSEISYSTHAHGRNVRPRFNYYYYHATATNTTTTTTNSASNTRRNCCHTSNQVTQ